MNTWPNGVRRALCQSEHNEWNDDNYPGTRQLCSKCDGPTGRCEEDSMNDDDGNSYCAECYVGIRFARVEWDYHRRVVYYEDQVYIVDDFGNMVPVDYFNILNLFISLGD